MLFKQIETHTVVLHKTMEIQNEEITEAGVTVAEFVAYLENPESVEDAGKYDICHELVASIAEERDLEEDWVSDRKGYTEIEFDVSVD
jgi:hypothetical protein